MQVLRMLADHKINPEQAERLLESLGRGHPEPVPADAQQAIGKLGEIIGRALTGRRERDQQEKRAEGERVREPEKGFALGAGDSLVVRARGANVHIVQRSDADVATVSSSGERPAAVRRSGTTCTVRASGREGNLDIAIPPISHLTVNLSGGNARLAGVAADVRISLRGGELTADGCTGHFDVKCMGGNADIKGLISGIDLKCMGGSVALDALRVTEGKHAVKAMGGRVDLALSPRSSVTVRTKVLGGAVASDVPPYDGGAKRGLDEYRIGDGVAVLDVKAMGGDVHIGLAREERSAASDGDPQEG